MESKAQFAQRMVASGVCDERAAAFCATAVALPNGSYGMCLLGVRGNTLSIYDTDMKSTVGQKLYSISLKDVDSLIINHGFLAELLKGFSFCFNYKGFSYKFKNCFQQKQALSIIESETTKRGN